ncbi:MAG: alkaline phosphatase D family protein [Alphaproteobacteria bacterium]|nr:alkaline phosphatase D family protein [Alphaproteobacteria bacterium]
MTNISRRALLATAAALGATAVFARAPAASRSRWREARQFFPEGVASGDPDSSSVILWTRRPYTAGHKTPQLLVEVAEDHAFARVVATAKTNAPEDSDWTARVLVGGLKPAIEYWYRFTDAEGNGSRIGRTLTAPADDDPRRVNFAFVSCQNANYGAQNAYRRMIYEDRRAAADDKLAFVLHLGDFIYELVWYPEGRAAYYDRHIRDIVRYAHGEKHEDFYVPTTIADYRAVYKAYLHDPDIQDARANFPFVAMWDNHEFSWQGWQSLQNFGKGDIPAQTRKVMAMQAWFEIHPARVTKKNPSLETFDPPTVTDAPITTFDDNGLGTEPNNLAAVNSLIGYRALRFGKNLELILTDQHSYRSQEPTGDPATAPLQDLAFFPEDAQMVLDAGREANGGKPPATIKFGAIEIANFRKDQPPQTILGATQKAWFIDRLKTSQAAWKVWGNTQATLDMRVDAQNLPDALRTKWPGQDYGGFGGGEPCTAYVERNEIYDVIAREGITGFATVAGDRHSFWAGLATKSLPPRGFEPVGIAFVTGSISAPGMAESQEHKLPKDEPLRPLFLADRADGKFETTVNLTLHHGVRTALEYAKSGDIAKARTLRNPESAPHVSFVDMGGHGYGVVRASPDRMDTEFVCIPRPVERAKSEDGGPLRYRVVHSAKLWRKGERPVLEQTVVEGDAKLSI